MRSVNRELPLFGARSLLPEHRPAPPALGVAPSLPPTARIACVFVPDFRLHVAMLGLGGDPEGGLGLVDPDDGRRLIVAASPNARLDGVRRGQTSIAATSLAPELVVRPIDRSALGATHRALEEVIRAVTPTFETTGEGVLYASYGGLESLYSEDGEGGFVDDLREAVRCLDLPVRIGVAGTRFAARAAAVMEGKLASYRGAIVVPPGGEGAFLRPLSVRLLPAALDVVEWLDRLGIHTLGGFADLPAPGIARRFGERGGALHRLARGEDRATLVPAPEPRAWSATVHADWAITVRDQLAELLADPLERIVGGLDDEGLAAGALEYTFVCDGVDPLAGVLRAAAPSGSLRLWTDLVWAQLERTNLKAGVLSATLTAADVGPRSAEQERLTGPRAAPPGALAMTLAHLAAEVGADRFGVLRPVPHPFPEARQELAVPGGFRPPSGRALPDPEPWWPDRSTSGELPRALRREDPPERLEVDLRAGRLSAFRTRAGWQPVDRALGPWDLSHGWWETERRRRYFQTEGAGKAALVYFDPAVRAWFLAGWFD